MQELSVPASSIKHTGDKVIVERKFTSRIGDVEVTVFLEEPSTGAAYVPGHIEVNLLGPPSPARWIITPIQARRLRDALQYCLRKDPLG